VITIHSSFFFTSVINKISPPYFVEQLLEYMSHTHYSLSFPGGFILWVYQKGVRGEGENGEDVQTEGDQAFCSLPFPFFLLLSIRIPLSPELILHP
jgi:hypothetical protein